MSASKTILPKLELEIRQRLINRLFWWSIDKRLTKARRDETSRALRNLMLVQERECRKIPHEP